MFYSQFILAKKGPLGTIWIAAHLERKLRKNQVADTDIGVSVDSILFPDMPIALRLSSHLLLGVVRIYSRKVNYLFDDCSEALLKVKQAFRSTAVDLPPEESTAPYHSITLPETFDLDDFELPDNEMFHGNYVDHHISSREQITLQDTMEGVVYSNSQFGLDERFGDGDASQIGLDLDEVLLTDKATTLEHDDCRASPQVSHQKDEMKEEIDDFPVATKVTEYAEGPSTPGLEEPNLVGTPVNQVNNEADYHNSADFTSTKSPQNDSADHRREHDVIDNHHENNDCVMVDLDGKKEEHEHLACMEIDQENLMVSSNKECPTTSVPECSGGIISASDMPEKAEDLHEEVLMTSEPAVAPLDQTVGKNVVSAGVETDETVSHVTSEQEDLSCRPLSNTDGSRGLEADVHTLSKNEILNDLETSKNDGNSCTLDVEAPAPQELTEAEALNHVSQDAVQTSESLLRPCTSHQGHRSLSSVEEPSVCKNNPDVGKSDVEPGSQIFSDKAECVNESAFSEMPEPEKLLSLGYHHDGEANDLLLESTPNNQGISDSHMDATRLKGMSGKKRSFTESTLTVQSMDMVESNGGAQSKRTKQSIPDDDDLLSSILVGRRSSTLKMKPSPAAPDIASTKRFRTATRTSAVKRKVLMDDMMVLHGDTIRQQLTNTEDIRRLRKKAPCTCHEIIMIQRQFMEDEIFHGSIFTGLSADLTVLQNETFNLSGIMVYDDGSAIEKTKDREPYSKTNTEAGGIEGNVESIEVELQAVAEVQPTEISVLPESNQSDVNLESHDIDAHGHNIIPHVSELDSSQNVEINNAETEDHSVGPGLQSSSLTEVIENDICLSNDPIYQDRLCIPHLENEVVDDKGNNRSRAGASEIAEHSVEDGTQVQVDGLEANDSYASLPTGSKDADEYNNNQASVDGNLPTEENGNSMLGVLNEDQIVASGLVSDEKTEEDCLESAPLVLEERESYLNNEENPVCQEAGLQSTECPEISAIRSSFVDYNNENYMIDDDTGFLNVGDDEIFEDDNDDLPSSEGTNLENSGWSSRTRAVAKYLQTLFDKEDLNGRQNLHLDHILAGKTRKEASRMFFETLVLKTKDYIHVEQPKPFASVNLKPRMKLMKSDF